MKKKTFVMMTLLIGLSLLFTGCIGSTVGTIPWLGQSFTADKIETIQLTDLNGDLVRELKPAEYEAIVDGIKNAQEDESPYIMMLAGYTMTILLDDGEIRFTSYGSQTNVVATITNDNETKSKHLVCPEIAQLLIEDLDRDSLNGEESEE